MVPTDELLTARHLLLQDVPTPVSSREVPVISPVSVTFSPVPIDDSASESSATGHVAASHPTTLPPWNAEAGHHDLPPGRPRSTSSTTLNFRRTTSRTTACPHPSRSCPVQQYADTPSQQTRHQSTDIPAPNFPMLRGSLNPDGAVPLSPHSGERGGPTTPTPLGRNGASPPKLTDQQRQWIDSFNTLLPTDIEGLSALSLLITAAATEKRTRRLHLVLLFRLNRLFVELHHDVSSTTARCFQYPETL